MDDPFVKWVNTYDPNAALHPRHLRAAWDAATVFSAERIRELETALSEFCKAWDGIVMSFDGMTTASSDNLEAARELAGDVLAKGQSQ